MILLLLPLLVHTWLLDRSWRLIGRDLQGQDAYQLLRAPILFAAVIAVLDLLSVFVRFVYPHGVWVLTGLPLLCLWPALGRRPERVAAITGIACLTIFIPFLRLDPNMILSAVVGLLSFGGVLIYRAAKEKPDAHDRPERVFRDRLPLMILCALCGLFVAGFAMNAFAGDTNPSDRLLCLVTLPAALPVLNLIPRFGKNKSALILLTSLGLLPAIGWPLTFIVLLIRAFG